MTASTGRGPSAPDRDVTPDASPLPSASKPRKQPGKSDRALSWIGITLTLIAYPAFWALLIFGGDRSVDEVQTALNVALFGGAVGFAGAIVSLIQMFRFSRNLDRIGVALAFLPPLIAVLTFAIAGS
ncbi:hypothetical protein GCM10010401_09600 [Rarobacter faecitabidus]|uniref:Uncharacterized protein n=1 Tax=Rarobacter faecitabidus TaxID=13243 RepID=A0A542ZA46_RARFA|nr:hypothetical protein [Rarobacter faecitabidus]TQL57214.1 hypothetical protein FB461_2335 [Rarobacter faecitabidus]